jgi:hypothetical protein
MREEPPRVAETSSELPAGVDDVIATAMAKRPDRRFSSCKELVAALRGEAGATTAQGTIPLRIGGMRRGRRLGRMLLVAIPAALALAAAASGLTYLLAHGNGHATAAPPVTRTQISTVIRSKPVEVPMTPADNLLLPHVPKQLRASCVHVPRLTPDFTASIACGGGKAGPRVQYNSAPLSKISGYSLTRVHGQGITTRGAKVDAVGSCDRVETSVRSWIPVPPVGHAEAPVFGIDPSRQGGRVLCYGRNGWAAIEWSDKRSDIYSVAFGGNRKSLVEWWKTKAGPLP